MSMRRGSSKQLMGSDGLPIMSGGSPGRGVTSAALFVSASASAASAKAIKADEAEKASKADTITCVSKCRLFAPPTFPRQRRTVHERATPAR
eukprot:scaffold75036_cov69-Phaeocystis_antarctica.AAC.1